MYIFTQIIAVNPYFLNPMLVVRHCGNSREKDIVCSLKITILITGFHIEVETK